MWGLTETSWLGLGLNEDGVKFGLRVEFGGYYTHYGLFSPYNSVRSQLADSLLWFDMLMTVVSRIALGWLWCQQIRSVALAG